MKCAAPCALTLLAALVLAACATVPEAERRAACQVTNWEGYGENDGLLGVPAGERDGKFADCAELGFPADLSAYQAGRERGLARYCTVENGYDVGYAGRRYRKVCPPELEVAFLQGYEQGRKERPVQVYPTIGFGIGFGSFYHHGYHGYAPYWLGYHRHRSHRGTRSQQAK